MQAPQLTDALGHALPRDGSHALALGTDGAKVTHKVTAAIDASVRRRAIEFIGKRIPLPLSETPIY